MPPPLCVSLTHTNTHTQTHTHTHTHCISLGREQCVVVTMVWMDCFTVCLYCMCVCVCVCVCVFERLYPLRSFWKIHYYLNICALIWSDCTSLSVSISLVTLCVIDIQKWENLRLSSLEYDLKWYDFVFLILKEVRNTQKVSVQWFKTIYLFEDTPHLAMLQDETIDHNHKWPHPFNRPAPPCPFKKTHTKTWLWHDGGKTERDALVARST